MGDYLIIKNSSKDGELAIHRRVFEELATEAVERAGATLSTLKIKNKILVRLFNPVKITFHRNGQVEIKIYIILNKNADQNRVSEAIKEEVNRTFLAYTESVTFDVKIKIEIAKK